MTNLEWLEQVVKAKTPGPWELDTSNIEDREIIFTKAIKGCFGEDKVSIGKTFQIVGDGQFISLMGTISDQLVAVSQAANVFKHCLIGDRVPLHAMIKINQALANLDTAITAARNGMVK